MRLVLLSLVLFAMPAFAVDKLGRLFFTPEQRAMLDLARRTEPSASQAEVESYEGVTLSGVVTRSDGKRMVWINGRPQPAGEGVTNGRSPASASIPLPSGAGRIRLKVGQTLDPTSGKVEEGYRRAPKPAPEQKAAPADSPTAKPAPTKPPRTAAPDADNDRADDTAQ
jgi:hypothetical protein